MELPAGIDALHIEHLAVNMGGKVDDVSSGGLQVLHHRDGILGHRTACLGAVAELHDLVPKAVGLARPGYAADSRLPPACESG